MVRAMRSDSPVARGGDDLPERGGSDIACREEAWKGCPHRVICLYESILEIHDILHGLGVWYDANEHEEG